MPREKEQLRRTGDSPGLEWYTGVFGAYETKSEAVAHQQERQVHAVRTVILVL